MINFFVMYFIVSVVNRNNWFINIRYGEKWFEYFNEWYE